MTGYPDEPSALWGNPGALATLSSFQVEAPFAYRSLDFSDLPDLLAAARSHDRSDPAQFDALRGSLESLAADGVGCVEDMGGGPVLTLGGFGLGVYVRSYSWVAPSIDLSDLSAPSNSSAIRATRILTNDYTLGYAYPLSFLGDDGNLNTVHLALAGRVISWYGQVKSVGLWDDSLEGARRGTLLKLAKEGEVQSGTAFTIDAGIHYNLGDLLHLGLTADGLTSPKVKISEEESVSLKPRARIGADTTIANYVRLSMDFDLTRNGLGLAGGGERILALGAEGAAFGVRLRGGIRFDTTGLGPVAYTVGIGAGGSLVRGDIGLLYSGGSRQFGAGGSLRFMF